MVDKDTKKCPYCGKEILAVAKKCRHCGQWMPNESPQKQKNEARSSVTVTVKEKVIEEKVPTNALEGNDIENYSNISKILSSVSEVVSPQNRSHIPKPEMTEEDKARLARKKSCIGCLLVFICIILSYIILASIFDS